MMGINSELAKSLQIKAYELRTEVVEMIFGSEGSAGHFGGSMSAAEIVSTLYWHIMKVDPKRPNWEERDRLVLGKGHSVPIVYAALAHKGYFDRAILRTYRDDGSILQGHPDCRKTPGLDMSSGSLGQGLSVALGMALGARHARKSYQVYALLSDGELEEGMVWEAAMAASHYKATNLTAIVDNNNLQVDGEIGNIMNLEPLADKWRAFGWEVFSVNGHDVPSLLAVFELRQKITAKPVAIICHTVKGKGVSFMENDIEWHCCKISQEERDKAVAELDKALAVCKK
jgi:transketolase